MQEEGGTTNSDGILIHAVYAVLASGKVWGFFIAL
jgi:hypothetical protein